MPFITSGIHSNLPLKSYSVTMSRYFLFPFSSSCTLRSGIRKQKLWTYELWYFLCECKPAAAQSNNIDCYNECKYILVCYCYTSFSTSMWLLVNTAEYSFKTLFGKNRRRYTMSSVFLMSNRVSKSDQPSLLWRTTLWPLKIICFSVAHCLHRVGSVLIIAQLRHTSVVLFSQLQYRSDVRRESAECKMVTC